MLRAMGGAAAAAPEAKRVRSAIVLALIGAGAIASSATAAVPVVRAGATPTEPRFGEAFTYVATVDVDATGPGSVEVADRASRFTSLAPTSVHRSVANGVARITVTQRLACLSSACVPRPRGRAVVVAGPRLTYDGASLAVPPLVVTVRARVPADAIRATEPSFRRSQGLPAATVRVEPTSATALLVALGAGVLLLGVATLAVSVRRRATSRAGPLRQDAIVRAVRLLRESTVRDAEARRRAASLVARVVDEPDLSRDAARVAWSRPEPGAPEAATLATTIEGTIGGRR